MLVQAYRTVDAQVAHRQGTYSLALTAGGTVWAWGANLCGQLGDGTTIARTAPVQVSDATSARDVGRPPSAASNSTPIRLSGSPCARRPGTFAGSSQCQELPGRDNELCCPGERLLDLIAADAWAATIIAFVSRVLTDDQVVVGLWIEEGRLGERPTERGADRAVARELQASGQEQRLGSIEHIGSLQRTVDQGHRVRFRTRSDKVESDAPRVMPRGGPAS